MVPPSLAVGFGTVHASLVSLSIEGRKKRQATVAIQAEPNLHLPGFLHPNVEELIAQRRGIIANNDPLLKGKSLCLVILKLSLFRWQGQ